mgnify:CR=1 FL=1
MNDKEKLKLIEEIIDKKDEGAHSHSHGNGLI